MIDCCCTIQFLSGLLSYSPPRSLLLHCEIYILNEKKNIDVLCGKDNIEHTRHNTLCKNINKYLLLKFTDTNGTNSQQMIMWNFALIWFVTYIHTYVLI